MILFVLLWPLSFGSLAVLKFLPFLQGATKNSISAAKKFQPSKKTNESSEEESDSDDSDEDVSDLQLSTNSVDYVVSVICFGMLVHITISS